MKSFLVVILCLSLFGCKKESPVAPTVTTSTRSLSMWGEFLVLDANMYVNNHDLGTKTVYQHFGAGKSVSSLRYEGPLFDIENIVQGVTTYSFYKPLGTPSSGKFILNGDTTKIYGLNVSSGFSAITENMLSTSPSQLLMGGSSRPFSGWTLDYDNKIIVLHIEEVEGSIGGYNCRYFTEMRMKKIKEW